MQIKNVLVAALVGLAAVEASVIPGDSPYAKTLARRQFRGGNGGRFGGGGRGGQQGGGQQGGGQQGGGQQNGGQQNGGQQGGGQQNGGQNGGQNNNNGGNNNNNNGGNNNAGGGGAITLNANLVQAGSNQPGNPQDGAVASATDPENFINFCEGQDLTNGEQKTGGSCNGIPMGKVPAQNRMVSSILVNPAHNDNIQADQDFDIQVQVDNFAPGAFTDAQSTYYSAPQDLDGQGRIIGHTHVTVQDMGGNLTPNQPLDATSFVFFKGINDAGNGNGLLSATVTGGLPAGNYRVCTMFAAANHQPVIMPVAQRGAQDDCNKFTVGGNNNNNNQGGNNNNNNNQGGQQGGNQGGNNNNNNQGGQGQNQGGNQGGQQGGQQGGNQGGNNQGGAGQDAAAGGDAGNNNGGNQGGNNGGNQGGQNGGNQGGNQGGQNGGNNGGNQGGNNGGNNNNNAGGGGGGGNGGASAANALGGIAAPEVTDSGNADRPFEVNGNTFTNKQTAAQRACDIQNNQCSDAVNRGQATGFAQSDCQTQIATCVAELNA